MLPLLHAMCEHKSHQSCNNFNLQQAEHWASKQSANRARGCHTATLKQSESNKQLPLPQGHKTNANERASVPRCTIWPDPGLGCNRSQGCKALPSAAAKVSIDNETEMRHDATDCRPVSQSVCPSDHSLCCLWLRPGHIIRLASELGARLDVNDLPICLSTSMALMPPPLGRRGAYEQCQPFGPTVQLC